MRFQHVLDRLPEYLGDLIARHFEWQPLSKNVAICIDDSDDSTLIGSRLQGTVRAHNPRDGMLLVHLAGRLDYDGGYTMPDLDMIVTTPAIRFHRANRLLITWVAVRVVDASSFAQQTFGRTIATGRLELDRTRTDRNWD